MSDINLYNLSRDELLEQARILGIVLRGNVLLRLYERRSKQRLRSSHRESEGRERRSRAKKDWITIVIAEDENDTQPFVGVNGKSYPIVGAASSGSARGSASAGRCSASRYQRWFEQKSTNVSISCRGN